MTGPFDRAWSRRPFVSPARWMPEMSVHDLWAETLVTFSRRVGQATPGGGIDSNAAASNYLSTYCHAELNSAPLSPMPMTGAEALIIANWWSVFLPLVVDDVPLDPSLYPKKGDQLQFVDDLGNTVTVDIRSVNSPDLIRDHLEIDSVTFE